MQVYVVQLLRDGANDGIRTRDLLITNQLLYQLSYIGVLPPRNGSGQTG
jgi:hypothetical protein